MPRKVESPAQSVASTTQEWRWLLWRAGLATSCCICSSCFSDLQWLSGWANMIIPRMRLPRGDFFLFLLWQVMGTDSSPLKSCWRNRVFLRKLKMGTLIMIMYSSPSHFPISISWITNTLLWAEFWVQWDSRQGPVIVRATLAPGSVGADAGGDVWWDREHQSPWRSFLGGFVSNFEAMFVPVSVRIYQCQDSRLRQCSFLKWTWCQFIDDI